MSEGIVIETTGSWHKLKMDDGRLLQARLQGKMRLSKLKVTNPVAVGDRVTIGNDEDSESIVIKKIKERRNQIIRISPRKKRHYHIIATNVDQAFIVCSMTKPKTKKGFISRMLVALEYYNIKPIVLFNKLDIYQEKEHKLLQQIETDLQQIGYETLITSATEKQGIDSLEHLLSDKVSVVTGPSGVGKSSLLNTLSPNLNLRTKAVSNYNEKGQHTTTYAHMYEVASNSFIIDTPGIKEYGVANIDAYELGFYFPEIKMYQNQCKFNNCQHLNEPKCAVKKALDQGEITEWRYKSYVQIREELLIENKHYL